MYECNERGEQHDQGDILSIDQPLPAGR
jgi:hypothetical protein